MEHGTPVAWDTAVRITPGHMKQNSGKDGHGKQQREFLDLLPQIITEVLSPLNTVPTLCSIQSVSSQQAALDDPVDGLSIYELDGARMHIWASSEGELGRMLCELAFGGSGLASGEDELSRPAAKIEKRLATNFLKAFARKIAESISTIGQHKKHSELELDKDHLDGLDSLLQYFEVKALINVFTYSCELTFRFIQSEFDALLKQETLGTANNVSAMDALGSCNFDLNVLLPPDEVQLSRLLALSPGEVLELSLNADSPVVVTCGGATLFSGAYDVSAADVRVVLMQLGTPPEAVSGNTEQAREALH